MKRREILEGVFRFGWLAALTWSGISLAEAQQVMMMKKKGGASACSTDCSSTDTIGAFNNWYYGASPFKPSANCTISSIDLWLYTSGSPTGTVTVEIREDNAGVPGSVLGTSSYVPNISTFTTEAAKYTFTGFSVAVTSGTPYWVTLHFSVYSDILYFSANSGCGSTLPPVKRADTPPTWSDNANSDRYMSMKLNP